MRCLILVATLIGAPASALMFASPAKAEDIEPMPPPAANYAAMAIDDLVGELRIPRANSLACTTTFPILSELSRRRPDLGELSTGAQQAEMICAYFRRDHGGAYRLLKGNPALPSSVTPDFALHLTTLAGEGPDIVAALRAIVLQGTDERRKSLSPEVFSAATSRLILLEQDAELDRLAVDIALRGGLDQLNDEIVPGLAVRALKAGGRDGLDAVEARSLLEHIEHPIFYVDLLGLRSFERWWPMIEQRAGANYSVITQRHRETALARHAQTPDDSDLLSKAVHALYYDGRFGDLIGLVDKATSRNDLLDSMQEGEAWSLNLKAYALDALGQRARADAVFDLLAQAAPRYPQWGVNFVINRALRLVGQKRWVEGLAAAEAAKVIADRNGSDYAKGLVAKAHICALQGLGRANEIAPHTTLLEGLAKQHPGIVAEGMLCLARTDDAARILIAGIANSSTRDSILEELQPEAFDLFYTRSELPQKRDLMATHPDLRSAFLKYARVIPPTYYPSASLKR